jgi:hypothetical protein
MKGIMELGLLDFIFQNLEVKRLKRNEVLEHLVYLNEIITPKMSAPDQVKYLGVKVQLNKRLIQLDMMSTLSKSWCTPITSTQLPPPSSGPEPVENPLAIASRCPKPAGRALSSPSGFYF